MNEPHGVAGPFRFQGARIVGTARGQEVRAFSTRARGGALVGVVNDAGQLIIREGAEVLVVVEVRQA